MIFPEFFKEFETLCVYFNQARMIKEQCILDDYYNRFQHITRQTWAALCRTAKHQQTYMPKINDLGRLYEAMPKQYKQDIYVHCVKCNGHGRLSVRSTYDGKYSSNQTFRCTCKAADKFKGSMVTLFDVMGTLIQDNKLIIVDGTLKDQTQKHNVVLRVEDKDEHNPQEKIITGIDMVSVCSKFEQKPPVEAITVVVKSDDSTQEEVTAF